MRAVKLMKVTLLLAAPILAVLLFGGVLPTPTAEATPTKVLTINPVLCEALTLTRWGNPIDTLSQCLALEDEASFRNLVKILREDNDILGTDPKPEDFALIDMDGGQMHDTDGTLIFLAFVTNDEPVAFYADKGVFPTSHNSSIFCGPSGPPGTDISDEDCDNDGVRGDGVVAVKLIPAGASRGPAEVRVRQGNIQLTEPYTIVGEPHKISVKPLKTVIQTGSPRCDMFTDTPTFLNALQPPETSPVLFTVTDSDGTPISGGFLNFTVSNPDGLTLALPLAPSLDLSAATLGVVAPNVMCGLAEPGEVTVTADIDHTVDGAPGETGHAKFTMTVQGAPTDMVLSANPPSITCDGVTSSTISAALTDAAGKPVVNGNRVHWQVRALGAVSSLRSTTTDGSATTVLTPLDGATGGVVVRAWVELPVPLAPPNPTPTPSSILVAPTPTPLPPQVTEPTDIERTLLVACQESAPPAGQPAGQPSGQPSGPPSLPVIQPPGTGTGAGHASHWWLALPLSAAALLLAGAGLALKRRAA